MTRLLAIIVLVFCSCNEPEEPDPCEEWTWIEEEGCSGDVCGDQPGASDYDCRDGECWCCDEHECWLP